MTRIVLVTPWFSPDLPDGAVQAFYSLASKLQKSNLAKIELWTTCAKDFYNWDNFYSPGSSFVALTQPFTDKTEQQALKLLIRRFLIDNRDPEAFNQVNAKLLKGEEITIAEEETFFRNIIKSEELCKALKDDQKKSDLNATSSATAYFFTPYMFGTTYFGSQIHPERSFIMPCLHDEGYLWKLKPYRIMLEQVAGLIFWSAAEQKLCKKLDLKPKHQLLLGLGLSNFEKKTGYFPEKFREKFSLEAGREFILYLGRKILEKNVPMLLNYFDYYIQTSSKSTKKLQLVLAGPDQIAIPRHLNDYVFDLGILSQADKQEALNACYLLVQPSSKESFSYVIMEAWVHSKPVLVNRSCEVTKQHCEASNGGLYFWSKESFKALLDLLLGSRIIYEALGQQGYNYIRGNPQFNWSNIIEKLLNFIDADVQLKNIDLKENQY